jgi:hypothetical protein
VDSQASSYDPRESAWSPYYFNATLLSYGNDNGFSTMEVTPTQHGAVMRFTFPAVESNPSIAGFNQVL